MFPFLIKTDPFSWQNENVLHLVKIFKCHNLEAEWRVGFNGMKWNALLSSWLRMRPISLSITSLPSPSHRKPCCYIFSANDALSIQPWNRWLFHAIIEVRIWPMFGLWCTHKVFVFVLLPIGFAWLLYWLANVSFRNTLKIIFLRNKGTILGWRKECYTVSSLNTPSLQQEKCKVHTLVSIDGQFTQHLED